MLEWQIGAITYNDFNYGCNFEKNKKRNKKEKETRG